jgi:hypothetical protein
MSRSIKICIFPVRSTYGVLADKLTPRNDNLGSVRFAMFNTQLDILPTESYEMVSLAAEKGYLILNL